MKPLALLGGALLVVVAAVVVYRAGQPATFVIRGRGVIGDTSAVSVTTVAVASEATDYQGNPVQAGPGHKFVLLDCRFSAPSNQVEFEDFQLVKERPAKVGEEVNLGDTEDSDSFYWGYLDASGHSVTQPPDSTGPFRARLVFKVPTEARQGYLSYWGLYWGPFKLD